MNSQTVTNADTSEKLSLRKETKLKSNQKMWLETFLIRLEIMFLDLFTIKLAIIITMSIVRLHRHVVCMANLPKALWSGMNKHLHH